MKYNPAFDGVRAVAILLVILNHLGLNLTVPNHPFWFLIDGMAGVRLFFVLSGFLITSILCKSIRDRGGVDLKAFWTRRIVRIFPPLFCFLATLAILTHYKFLFLSKPGFFHALFSVFNFVPHPHRNPELTHTWSLSVEEQFYLLWPLLLWFRPRWGITFATVFVLLCTAFRIFLTDWQMGNNYTIHLWTIPAADSIAIGCLFALWSNGNGKVLTYFKEHTVRISVTALALWLASYPNTLVPWVGPLLQAMAFGLFVLLFSVDNTSRVARLLSAPAITWLGKISYSLYLWQGLFLRTGPTDSSQWFQRPPANITLTMVCTLLSYYGIERLYRKYKKGSTQASKLRDRFSGRLTQNRVPKSAEL